jgi:hypothetical protein
MKRLMSGLAASLVVMATVSLVGTVSSSALSLSLATPSISISPSFGLTNGQQVTISGTGFAPNQTAISALECIWTASSTTGCSTSLEPLTANAAGQITSTFTVTTGAIGNGTCGTTLADANCLISIISSATNTVVAFASLSFNTGPGVGASPSTNLSSGASVSISGAGFPPSVPVYALECLETSTDEAGCATGTATPIKVSSAGTLTTTTFQVIVGAVGKGSCGTNATDYDACMIEIANAKGDEEGVATIDFAAPQISVHLAPTATHVSGYAVLGRSVNIAVLGKNFTAGPTIVGPAGTTATVLSHTSSRIVIKVRESTSVKKGTYRLTITFANSKKTSIAYNVK